MAARLRVKPLSAPTGFGKTAVYVGYGIWTGQSTCFVTDNRGLQDQLMEEFSDVGMVDIRGRRNYPCSLRPDYTCEEGQAARCPDKGSAACPFSAATQRAATSRLVVTNYDKWTSSRKFGQGMDHFTQVVFDEGHRAPAALARAMQVVLHSPEIERDLGVPFPGHPDAEEFVNWKLWAGACRIVAEDAYNRAKEAVRIASFPKPTLIKELTHLRHLLKRLSVLALANPANWIVDELKNGYQFDPIQPAKYAESALLLKIPSILVVSATLVPKTLYMMGIYKDSYEFHEYPSDFDPSRSPVYYIPTMRVDRRSAPDLSLLWLKLDQIGARRQDRKGIVHTISFARRDDLGASSRFASMMLFNERGEAPTELVEQFKRSGPGHILVSPSVGAGYDFPGKECEWQFVCKIPFEPPSRIVKAREAVDREYRGYQAMGSLIQMFGRGTRMREDQCEGFICDDHLEWFYPRYKKFAPKSFQQRFKQVSVVPPPPPRL